MRPIGGDGHSTNLKLSGCVCQLIHKTNFESKQEYNCIFSLYVRPLFVSQSIRGIGVLTEEVDSISFKDLVPPRTYRSVAVKIFSVCLGKL